MEIFNPHLTANDLSVNLSEGMSVAHSKCKNYMLFLKFVHDRADNGQMIISAFCLIDKRLQDRLLLHGYGGTLTSILHTANDYLSGELIASTNLAS